MNSSSTHRLTNNSHYSTTSGDTVFIDPEEGHKNRTEYIIAIGIVTYIWPLIVVCGTLGNILSFCVLMRQAMSDTSVYFYLAMLALADIGVLILSAFKTWIRVVTGFELLHVSGVTCKVIMYVFLICLHMSAWFVIAVTVDRFIVIWLPLRNHRARTANPLGPQVYSDTQQCKFVSIGMLFILLVYNGHLLWTINLQAHPGELYTCSYSQNNYFMVTVYPVMKLLSYCIVPFFTVFILNASIIARISQTKPMLSANRSSYSRTKSIHHQSRITGMLLTVSITWLLLTGPFTIWSLVPSRLSNEAQSFLVKTICFTLMYLNHSINFYLYCLTGARFRRQLNHLITTYPRTRHQRTRTYRSTPTSLKTLKISNNQVSMEQENRV